MPAVNGQRAAPKAVTRKVHLGGTAPVDCPVYQRDDLAAGFTFKGPALVQEYASTTVMFAGDSAKIADTGEIVIEINTRRCGTKEERERDPRESLEFARDHFAVSAP